MFTLNFEPIVSDFFQQLHPAKGRILIPRRCLMYSAEYAMTQGKYLASEKSGRENREGSFWLPKVELGASFSRQRTRSSL
jgi:hypothetical protein